MRTSQTALSPRPVAQWQTKPIEVASILPARLIRDGLLDSESVLSLPVEARWLYVSILLSADDVGLFEATPFRLARRADIQRGHADRLLQMLVDADLVRLYEVDGRRYGFIPRFGQRLQIKRCRFPLPGPALLHGDSDAINKINHLASNPTVDFRESPRSTAAQQPEPEPEPEQKNNTSPPPPAGEPPPKRAPKGSRLPSDWAPDDEALAFAAGLGMRREAAAAEAAKFRDYWVAKPGAGGVKLDWAATWRNWCRRATEHSGNQRAGPPARQPTAAEQRVMQACPDIVAPHLKQFLKPQQVVIDMEDFNAPKRLD